MCSSVMLKRKHVQLSQYPTSLFLSASVVYEAILYLKVLGYRVLDSEAQTDSSV